jgi:Fibrinogen beta and gamma chains, C-terminal globular domain
VTRRAYLAFLLTGSAGCAAIAGLHEYASPPPDGGAVSDGGTISDGGETISDGGETTDGSPSDGSPSDGAAIDGDAGGLVAASCKALLAADRSTAGHSAMYTIDPDGPGGNAPVAVYCEMSLDQGGWTLVGRSAGSATPFGWTNDTGTPTDMTVPYSLDVTTLGLAFSQLLVADADGQSLEPSTRAYRISVPIPFLSAYPNAAVATSGAATILGDCNPPGGPQMLRFAGATSRTDSFFLRDIKDITQNDGLLPTGFALTYDDCPRGGMLNGVAGLLFVR